MPLPVRDKAGGVWIAERFALGSSLRPNPAAMRLHDRAALALTEASETTRPPSTISLKKRHLSVAKLMVLSATLLANPANTGGVGK